jgi:hypothetical protein
MRKFLLPFAGVLLVSGISRAEFDRADIAAKPAQAARTAFDAGNAATKRIRAADDFQLFLTGVRPLVFAIPPPPGVVVVCCTPATPQPIIKNPSNIPRPRR